MLGDFNCSIATVQHPNRSSTTVFKPVTSRSGLLATYLRARYLHLPIVSQPHRTDWGAALWSSVLCAAPPPLSTASRSLSDHVPLVWRVSCPVFAPRPVRITRRLLCRNLKNELNQLALRQDYEHLHATLLQHVAEARRRRDPFLLEVCYNTLVEVLFELGSAAIGSVEYPNVRLRPPRVFSDLRTLLTHDDCLSLWKSAGRFGPSIDIQPSSDHADVFSSVDQYYATLFRLPATPENHPAHILLSSPPPWPADTTFPGEFLSYFNASHIQRSIQKLKARKACGPDSLPPALFKTLCPPATSTTSGVTTPPPKFAYLISELFFAFFELGFVPSSWNDTTVNPLRKKVTVGPIHMFRPITLTNLFRRLFESCLLRAFFTHEQLRTVFHLSDLQGGFRNAYSCYTHALTLHETFLSGGAEHVVFIDLKNAYDTVPTNLLWHKLASRGLPLPFGRLLQALFDRTTGKATINGQLTPGFHRTRGLLQGSLLSPLLFDCFIDDLAETIAQFGNLSTRRTPGLFFADDIVLASHDSAIMNEMLHCVDTWCYHNLMTVGIEKCGTFTHFPEFRLAGQPIPVVPSYDYLGIPFTKHGIHFAQLLSSRITRARHKLGLYQLILSNLSSIHPANLLVLYKVFLRPTVEYGLPLLACAPAHARNVALRHFDDFQADALRRLSHISRRATLVSPLISIYGLSTATMRMSELALRFCFHLSRLPSTHPLLVFFPPVDPSIHPPPPTSRKSLCPIPRLFLPPNTSHISPLFFTLDIYVDYRSWVSTVYPTLPRTMTEINGIPQSPVSIFLRAIRFSHYNSLGVLASAVPFESRKPSTLVDRSLLQPSSEIAWKALMWRCNLCLHQRVCHFCAEYFNRKHLDRCPYLGQILPYTLRVQAVSQAPEVPSLDYMLNIGLYDDFFTTIQYLERHLLSIHSL